MFITAVAGEDGANLDDSGARSAATREAILEAASHCVRRFGTRRTTMEEVARQAKLSRGAVYRYFPEKDALIDAVLLRNGHRVRLRLEKLLDGAPTFEAKLERAVAFAVTPHKGELLLDLAETEPEQLAMMLTVEGSPWIVRAARFWEPHIAEAKRARQVRRDVDPAAAAEWIARALYSLAVTPSPRVDPRRPAATAEFVVPFLLRGLR